MDYRKILKDYMSSVLAYEGTTFVGLLHSFITPTHYSELVKIHDEIFKEQKLTGDS